MIDEAQAHVDAVFVRIHFNPATVPSTTGVSMTETQDLSFGEKAVGLTFNPGNNPEVDECKKTFARAINQMDQLRKAAVGANQPEIARMASIAITEAQTAQMWAVKAITWRP